MEPFHTHLLFYIHIHSFQTFAPNLETFHSVIQLLLGYHVSQIITQVFQWSSCPSHHFISVQSSALQHFFVQVKVKFLEPFGKIRKLMIFVFKSSCSLSFPLAPSMHHSHSNPSMTSEEATRGIAVEKFDSMKKWSINTYKVGALIWS